MTDQQTPQSNNQNIAQAIQEVSDRAQLLVREEIELAKAEVSAKVSKLIKGAVVGIAAGIFLIFGLFLLLDGFAWLAYWAIPFPEGQFFWGFFVVAASFVVAIDSSAPSPAKRPDQTRRLTMSFSIGRTLSHAVAGTASSPPQIVSTTSALACSYSASPRGKVSKIQPDSTCSMTP
jgi:uncharacterized membrane protein YgcG